MFHVFAVRFDVTENLKNFLGELNKALVTPKIQKKIKISLHQTLQHMHRALKIDRNKN